MREIKFRAWDKGRMIEPMGLLMRDAPQWLDKLSSEAILMQYTGLHDRNGKEIWEGDIVYYQETKCEVIFHILFFGFILQTKESRLMMHEVINFTVDSGFGIQTKQLEVIGNIYENPDLLK